MHVRWPHLSTADCHLARLSFTTSFFICSFRSLSVSWVALSRRFRTRSSASGLADAGRVGLKCWMRSAGMVWPLALFTAVLKVFTASSTVLIRLLQQGICRMLQHDMPSLFSWSGCRFAEAHQSRTVRSWWWWGWANDRWPVRWRLSSLIAVRCHWRPNWCRANLTGHFSVAA